ncbi:protein windpipe [Scaptodrosophila lebanonensis]|uniref:Protein windpipe n=1 Tax=Drosophila lebanonensis TaxID=7225 RepID=A0A6J2UF44_DROLE|nr:protein windpipe [Scaptodrosophila lebanonensis]XP_030387087.1 protein windpipe [Scaptodrosophila lebanonensis]
MESTAIYSTLMLALLLSASVTATPTPTPTSTPSASPAYECPSNCTCNLARNTHKPLLHAKCNSTEGLRALQAPLQTTLPIHSIDLSYLELTRLSHALTNLPNLTSVDLSHNELHEIGHLSKRIKKLNLKHNRLTSSKLVKLPQHLQVLNLQHNAITNLPLELTHLHHLMQLELSHNSINCSCETLEVRNWLQERHVYMEHAVVCSYPVAARGKPWLQIKQSDVCAKERRGWYTPDVDENELMMGDQPVAESGEHEAQDEQELGKDFLPVDDKGAVKSSEQHAASDVEGSGDLSHTNMEINLAEQEPIATTQSPVTELENEDEDNDEGSGSGGGTLIIPHLISDPVDADDFDHDDTNNNDNNDDEFDNNPVEDPGSPSPNIFQHMGIFEGAKDTEPKPVSEEPIVPIVHKQLDTGAPTDVITDGPLDVNSNESEDILTANVSRKDDTNATYFLLAVIALIVLGLILFVAIKRCKYNNSQAARDAEAQRQTELLDMDKKNLGKPVTRNGHEHSPLIAEKTKLDEAQIVKKPYNGSDAKDGAGQQPLLNGNGSANGGAKDVPTINEPAGESAAHEYYPITPRYPTPQSPRASKYAQNPQSGEQNNNEPEDAYLPSSPKSGRYSPVYSPETGRVKIKLTETPKPKTPMLVTRSKSNAGDIITTPVRNGDTYLVTDPTHPAVHQPVGQLSH